MSGQEQGAGAATHATRITLRELQKKPAAAAEAAARRGVALRALTQVGRET
jgi:hypothetical protein